MKQPCLTGDGERALSLHYTLNCKKFEIFFVFFFLVVVFLQVSHFRLPLTLTISTLHLRQFFFDRKQPNVEHRQNFLASSKTLSVF